MAPWVNGPHKCGPCGIYDAVDLTGCINAAPTNAVAPTEVRRGAINGALVLTGRMNAAPTGFV